MDELGTRMVHRRATRCRHNKPPVTAETYHRLVDHQKFALKRKFLKTPVFVKQKICVMQKEEEKSLRSERNGGVYLRICCQHIVYVPLGDSEGSKNCWYGRGRWGGRRRTSSRGGSDSQRVTGNRRGKHLWGKEIRRSGHPHINNRLAPVAVSL